MMKELIAVISSFVVSNLQVAFKTVQVQFQKFHLNPCLYLMF